MIKIKTRSGFARYLIGKKIVGIDFCKDRYMPDKIVLKLEDGGRLQFFAREPADEFGEIMPQAEISFWKAKEASND